tara:strand:+ start:1259 stop:1468 length:210 start_codon:yes stop_codon:yes gene_type:complete
MDKKRNREYEVLNVNTGKWEQKTMTESQYEDILNNQEKNLEAIEAEYEIVSKIIAQQIGVDHSDKKSMD